jgi:hypothetical protein
MASAAYIDKHRQGDRHVSVTKLTVMLTNLALWASLITGLAVLAR